MGATLAPGLVVAGKYALLRPLARGAMGEVWVAKHTSLGGEFAIKFLSREPSHDGEDAATAMARFRFEAQVAAKLSRKTRHIVGVSDHGEELGWAYLVMELIEGTSLETRMKAAEMDLDEVAPIVWQVARGLAHAHGEGVFHRDLKPANILLTKDEDGELLVKILDFGIAKTVRQRKITHSGATQSHATEVGIVLGTPNYMSPEQARGLSTLDHRCDLWALATVAYEALTGRLPYDGETTADLLVNICSDDAESVRKYRPDLSKEVEKFFEKAFAPSVRDRYPDAASLAQALADAAKTAFVSREPPIALPMEPISAEPVPFVLSGPAPAAASAPRPPAAPTPQTPHAIAAMPAAPPAREATTSRSLEAYEPPRGKAGLYVVLGLIAAAAIALLMFRFASMSTPGEAPKTVAPTDLPLEAPPKLDLPPPTPTAAVQPSSAPPVASAAPAITPSVTSKPTSNTKPTGKVAPTATPPTTTPTTTVPTSTAKPPKPLDKGEIL